MTARPDATPTRYSRAESMRQAALDHVWANPGITGAEIIKHFGWGHEGTANSRLKNMCDLGEMIREAVTIQKPDRNGRMVTSNNYRYTAIKRQTISAETVRRKAESERKPYAPREPQTQRQAAQNMAKEPPKPWLTRHVDPDRAPLKNQGGQGAVQRRVVIGSTL